MTPISSRHLVDPELLPLLDTLPSTRLSKETLGAMRTRSARFAVDPADIARTQMTTLKAPGPSGAPDVGVIVYRPKAIDGPLPCIFHIHGGGYVAGSAPANEAIHRPLAVQLGCCIVSVEYRLAPETVFPGAIEDCYAALSWLFANCCVAGR